MRTFDFLSWKDGYTVIRSIVECGSYIDCAAGVAYADGLLTGVFESRKEFLNPRMYWFVIGAIDSLEGYSAISLEDSYNIKTAFMLYWEH